MKNLLIKLVLFGLLLMLIVAPFAGVAPLMIVILAFATCWIVGSLIQAFFTTDVAQEDNKAGFEPSRGE